MGHEATLYHKITQTVALGRIEVPARAKVERVFQSGSKPVQNEALCQLRIKLYVLL